MASSALSWQEGRGGGWLDRHFGISARQSTVNKEVLGGVTTFLVGAYIIFVNPAILSFAGQPDLQKLGAPFAATLAVTALTAGVMSLMMGLWAGYPFMMAPGMGLNAFVAFTLIVGMKLTWQEAMGVIFLEGVAITILVLLGFRQAVMNAIPDLLKHSIAVGIGFFILFIGLVNSGLVVVGVPGDPVRLGDLRTVAFSVSVVGFALIAMLEMIKVRGSLLLGIVLTTVYAIVANSLTGGMAFSGTPGVAVLPLGVLSSPDFSSLGAGFNLGVFAKVGFLAALVTVLSVMLSDFFDTMGTLVGVGEQAGFLDKDGKYPERGLSRLLLTDSLGALFGGLAGSSSNTTYIESAAGVSQGARTGLASVVTGVLFLLCMFLAPLAGVIPAQATAPALVIVGLLMFKGNIPQIVREIDKPDNGDAIALALPAILAMLVMPFTYSITNGIGVAVVAYVFLQVVQLWRDRQHFLNPMLLVVALAFIVYFAIGVF